ncbi:MAG: F0F1 ATP synthase subunit epsilon [Candidatus Microthrix subdominans]|jgi:F-type H+-transporting ATPase subunit epsilon|uniref:F0F1 ATP synthase subunit epsilon n=1 Tax=Candidatus Neomicrothrix sp. TaxID=2719034 RepID=UPI001B50A4E4|nr:F0F1 ATP synthase subunit epsilon [Candidatus Microthrix sp.]MBK6309500.1 F0F1 ATP synthase subunit epsilon [Candidatus Microthrix sp.]MBK6437652.1 F0F1 ATP synthase subunit epsilon [Candidatus Microthrix sp.]MBK6970076.1 F0F1 ATP synthase subunit epsilon [Candidatus Microthrix sp.]MBK7167565.1 F0F1 ATP synthase subunit epsilon [Candidatus Microthrix sp.]MBK9561351.1 F0F1 ATP synthase subunit epsilon [Candidatus Microthrix sp.]
MTGAPSMRLRVVTPGQVALDTNVDKVSAEATNGAFTLLPRHIDFVAPLAQGLLTYVWDDEEFVVALDGGLLVKCGTRVDVVTAAAFSGDDLRSLDRELDTAFEGFDEGERSARRAMADLESDITRRLLDLDRDAIF